MEDKTGMDLNEKGVSLQALPLCTAWQEVITHRVSETDRDESVIGERRKCTSGERML